MTEQDFHEGILAVINALITLDPPADSPEGRLLVLLASATESYEKERFPLLDADPEKP